MSVSHNQLPIVQTKFCAPRLTADLVIIDTPSWAA
jgi:hypothetical protein